MVDPAFQPTTPASNPDLEAALQLNGTQWTISKLREQAIPLMKDGVPFSHSHLLVMQLVVRANTKFNNFCWCISNKGVLDAQFVVFAEAIPAFPVSNAS